MLKKLQRLLRKIMWLPLHPQWFTRKESALLQLFPDSKPGDYVLDIGCADQWIKAYLPSDVIYIGLDYPDTSEHLYQTRPNIFGGAEDLPFADNCMNKIYLLDVLEHLENPLVALKEASRVLLPDGEIVIRIPFLYPIHDAPRDFTRFTFFGLQSMAGKCSLELVQWISIGQPLETAALIRNLAYSKAIVDLIAKRHPLCILGTLLPVYFLINNIVSLLLSKILPTSSIMPHSYLLRARKKKPNP